MPRGEHFQLEKKESFGFQKFISFLFCNFIAELTGKVYKDALRDIKGDQFCAPLKMPYKDMPFWTPLKKPSK